MWRIGHNAKQMRYRTYQMLRDRDLVFHVSIEELVMNIWKRSIGEQP